MKDTPTLLHDAMRYAVFPGGKRFRPLLCLGACEAVTGDPEPALIAACAVELIHAYSLVHDDLPAMDNAEERRGKPSCHRRFGEANAILAGDALLTRAFEWLSLHDTVNALAILRTLGQASGASGLIGGQVLDLTRTDGASQLERIARQKTAALMTASVVAGALAGDASPDALRHLRRFGERMGLAFQLVDDLHDRDGMARVMDPTAVRQRADRLLALAKQELRPFGARAWVLHALAEWLT